MTDQEHWPEEFELGEKMLRAVQKANGTSDEDIEYEVRYYNGGPRMKGYTKQAEIFLELLGQPVGSSAVPAVFRPIERTRENIDRIWALTRATAIAPGEYEDKPDYNPHD